MVRLGSTVARLKLKGIDGDPHKQRSVWFNSMQREEPYQGLTCICTTQRWVSLRGGCTGAAWLSSARVVRCWVKSRNERNPYCVLYHSHGTAERNSEEGGDDVKSAWPLYLGLHTRYNGRYSEKPPSDREQTSKAGPSSDCTLQPECMKSELLVTAHQPWRGEYVPGPCTHRPSRHGSWSRLKSAR